MEKDTIEAAHRVIARIEQRREAHKADERAKNKRASALLETVAVVPTPEFIGADMAIGPDHTGTWTLDQRPRHRPPRSMIGKAVYAGLLDFWEAAIDDMYMRQLNRRCICCGAPADRVQHD